jgi:hypothetical protein
MGIDGKCESTLEADTQSFIGRDGARRPTRRASDLGVMLQ